MIIRKAEKEDLDIINKLYENAKTLLKDRGIDQWQTGYPNKESAREDILAGDSYVLVEDQVIGTAYIGFGTEPTYLKIKGKWLTDASKYIFIHRVAVDTSHSGRGLALKFFKYAQELSKDLGAASLRCDTHRDNVPMQKSLLRMGFIECGMITLEDGTDRLAYEKLLK